MCEQWNYTLTHSHTWIGDYPTVNVQVVNRKVHYFDFSIAEIAFSLCSHKAKERRLRCLCNGNWCFCSSCFSLSLYISIVCFQFVFVINEQNIHFELHSLICMSEERFFFIEMVCKLKKIKILLLYTDY